MRKLLPISVVYTLTVIVATSHLFEHILAMIQKFVWDVPPEGLIGQLANKEWLHIWYNVPFYFVILFIYLSLKRYKSGVHSTEVSAGLSSLQLFFWIQGYHLLEHVTKIIQYTKTGVEGTPGILGNVFDLVILHFVLVLVTYLLLIPPLFRNPVLNPRFPFSQLVKSLSHKPSRGLS